MKKVLVTGANGHIGINLVKILLERDYMVYAGVRNIEDKSKTATLEALGATLVQADITQMEQLLLASQGMDGVFHLAAVFAYGNKDVENRIIKPTISGTINMVEAAIENRVKKLILTSSVVAVGGGRTADTPHDESHWNDGTKIPYYIAKIESERQAWALVKGSEMKMNTIHPGAVIGPGFERSTPSTDIFINTLSNNYPGIPPIRLSLIDARDVAMAHVLVYEEGNSDGRYIASGTNFSFEDVIDKIISLRPKTKKPSMKMPAFFLKFYAFSTTLFKFIIGKSSDYTYRQAKEQTNDKAYFSDAKLEALGWKKRDIDTSFDDTISWIEEQNMIK